MPTYINNETGEQRSYSKVRTYINDDGTKREVDLDTNQPIPEGFVLLSDSTDYKTITAKKSPTDGYGTR